MNRLPGLRRPGYFILAALFLSLLLAGCESAPAFTGIPSALEPRGPAAASIANLWWLMFGLGMLVLVLVTALTIYAVTARRRGQQEPGPESLVPAAPDRRTWIWYGGILLPAVILPIVLAFTVTSLRDLGPTGQQPDLRFEIVGRQWFWRVYGPERSFETANELHIPIGVPVHLTLLSEDVIHSFWVPELHGKVDLIPGRTNEFWIQADQPGVYRGLCAEFCGLQHANMQFVVVAEPQEDFERWLEREAQPAAQPDAGQAARGQEVFQEAGCAACHTVRGTQATGAIGPDLTHIASRLTLAAGILENTRANLGAWIVNPQHVKPGNNMPALPLGAEDVQALLDYLEVLE